jgi:aminoglycoside phosphotransferase (APT) family kinase protein
MERFACTTSRGWGWDNRTFYLGKQMLVRMPSAAKYAMKVEIEQKWLPKLAPLLPLPIPEPLAMGEPGEGYPSQLLKVKKYKTLQSIITHKFIL